MISGACAASGSEKLNMRQMTNCIHPVGLPVRLSEINRAKVSREWDLIETFDLNWDPLKVQSWAAALTHLPLSGRLSMVLNACPGNELSRCIRTLANLEPVLLANLLRIRAYPILRQGHTLMEGVTDIQSSLVLAWTLSPQNTADDIHQERYQLHVLRTALRCRVLARHSGDQVNTEIAYQVGLLHDLGKWVLYSGRRDEFSRRALSGCDLEEEKSELSYTHSELAGWILASWRQPDLIRLPVEYHHQPELMLKHQSMIRYMTYLLHLADHLDYQRDEVPEHNLPPLDEHVWQILDINPSLLLQIDREWQQEWVDLKTEYDRYRSSKESVAFEENRQA